MNPYVSLSRKELQDELSTVQAKFEAIKAKKLNLDMSRGKPSAAQLDMVSDILNVLTKPEQCIVEGVDARNYGGLRGLPVAQKYFGEVLGCAPECVYVAGNSSLSMMYSIVATGMAHGLFESEKPWRQLRQKPKFICPVPGYDRHFNILAALDVEAITVPMTPNGPDMDRVEELIQDEYVRGMWCVPKFSNPDGIVYSEETVRRLANMKPAAKDFVLMWDNAYCVHEFEGDFVPFEDILTLCREAGRPNMVFEFASTSKITFPGAGVAVMAASEDNLQYLMKFIGTETISYNKINQLRHVLYLKDKAHTLELMKRHAEIMRPKFHLVLDILEQEIAPRGLAEWQKPKGGYFVSVNAMEGTAKRTLQLCAEAGVVMTPAGATFPYGNDPKDSNIRVAPSLPPLSELEAAMEVFCICLRIAALEKLLAN